MSRPRSSWCVAGSHEDLAIRVAKTGVGARHLSWSVLLSSSKRCSLLEWKRVEVGDVVSVPAYQVGGLAIWPVNESPGRCGRYN
jgi:hypothetical protein